LSGHRFTETEHLKSFLKEVYACLQVLFLLMLILKGFLTYLMIYILRDNLEISLRVKHHR
jgi:hypothetical protein